MAARAHWFEDEEAPGEADEAARETEEEAAKAGEETLGISNQFHNLEIMLPNLAMSHYRLGENQKFRFYRDRCNRDFPNLSWTKQLNKLEA